MKESGGAGAHPDLTEQYEQLRREADESFRARKERLGAVPKLSTAWPRT
jgi:hypothetical protein